MLSTAGAGGEEDIHGQTNMLHFALIGAAGYIAPRHMQAIKESGQDLVAALDPNDSVGIIDSYFPDSAFFTEFERFDRHVDKRRRSPVMSAIDYMAICSPNYLHDSHVRYALRSGAHAICEKPLVLNPWNIDGLQEIETATGCKVNTILQLRLHPAIIDLRDRIVATASTSKHEVDLAYITSRGKWYLHSWKGDVNKSGGVATNIGVHFFDMLHFIFGALQENVVHYATDVKVGGYLEFERARVRWFLSVDARDLPEEVAAKGQRTYRSITVDGTELEFSGGFSELHNRSYEEILAGRGFRLEDNRVAIEAVSRIRHCAPEVRDSDECHPILRNLADRVL